MATKTTPLPRGTKGLVEAFQTTAAKLPTSQRAAAMDAALTAIRDGMKQAEPVKTTAPKTAAPVKRAALTARKATATKRAAPKMKAKAKATKTKKAA